MLSLWSVVQKNVGFEEYMKHRIKCDYMKWREISEVES